MMNRRDDPPATDEEVVRQQRAYKRQRWWRRPTLMASLQIQNLFSRNSIVDATGPVVSLTSFGPRVATVHLTIESIARGTQRPSRLVLWLAQRDLDRGLPPALERLKRRGLTVAGCPDWGPHKKYFPEVCRSEDADLPLVTADDDHFYPAPWLAELWAASKARPEQIHCHRARRISLDASGALQPYRRWGPCTTTEASVLNFSVGGSGVLYPPLMRRVLAAEGDTFMQFCARADDIWLNVQALRHQVPVHQIHTRPWLFDELPWSRKTGLAKSNVKGGGNDEQIARTYTRDDLSRLARAVTPLLLKG